MKSPSKPKPIQPVNLAEQTEPDGAIMIPDFEIQFIQLVLALYSSLPHGINKFEIEGEFFRFKGLRQDGALRVQTFIGANPLLTMDVTPHRLGLHARILNLGELSVEHVKSLEKTFGLTRYTDCFIRFEDRGFCSGLMLQVNGVDELDEGS